MGRTDEKTRYCMECYYKSNEKIPCKWIPCGTALPAFGAENIAVLANVYQSRYCQRNQLCNWFEHTMGIENMEKIDDQLACQLTDEVERNEEEEAERAEMHRRQGLSAAVQRLGQ